jgi:hypothetical protein
MRGVNHTTATDPAGCDPRLTPVKSGYHRVLAAAVDKVVEYRVSPDVVTAVALGSARGVDAVASLGWRSLTVIALTVIVAIVRIRRARRTSRTSEEGRIAHSCNRIGAPRAALRRHPRRPPSRPLQPFTSRRPHRRAARPPVASRRRALQMVAG